MLLCAYNTHLSPTDLRTAYPAELQAHINFIYYITFSNKMQLFFIKISRTYTNVYW